MKVSTLKGCKVEVAKPKSLNYPIIITDKDGNSLVCMHIPTKQSVTKKFKDELIALIKSATI